LDKFKQVSNFYKFSILSSLLILLIAYPISFVYLADDDILSRLYSVGIIVLIISLIGILFEVFIPDTYKTDEDDDKESINAKLKANSKTADFYRVGLVVFLMIAYILDLQTGLYTLIVFFIIFGQLYYTYWLKQFDDSKYDWKERVHV